jgi:hypothetical protein
MNTRTTMVMLALLLSVSVAGCGGATDGDGAGAAAPEQASEPESLPNGLMLALARIKKVGEKYEPQPARLGILTREAGEWRYRTIDDPDSNVFHKAMVYAPVEGEAGVLTLGGTRAILKWWRAGAEPAVLWEADFGGKFSRMRDAEAGDLYGDGASALAVATHDQGVVAVVKPDGAGGYTVQELDRQPETIVHEIEIGDLNQDGTLEVYATPSKPNKLDGSPQPGEVVRYVPAEGQGPTVVAALGDDHAKEILVDDVDGDGRQELYVSVEAVSGGQIRIVRFDADTPADGGVTIATIDDKLCRFLTAGDVDGDGKKEMVAATHKKGLWLLRPGSDPQAEWSKECFDTDSSGFEHATVMADLDEDGVQEVYVANDKAGEVNRYVWQDGAFVKTTLYEHEGGVSGFTWNVMPVPVELMP